MWHFLLDHRSGIGCLSSQFPFMQMNSLHGILLANYIWYEHEVFVQKENYWWKDVGNHFRNG